MSRVHLRNFALAALPAGALTACATLPSLPAVNHAPTIQSVNLTTAGGQTHAISVTIPYRSDCAAFPSYTSTYIRSFSLGYVGEWNTQIGALESNETSAAKKKAYKNSWLKTPDQIIETGSVGLQESNCLGAADMAEEDGRTKAHNDLIANPPVS